MSSEHTKNYQLWVWYNTQNGDNPQNGYSLVLETDDAKELLLPEAKLSKDDERLITKAIDLHVQVL